MAVLVVDDDADLRRYVRRSLERTASRARIREARNGVAALEALRSATFDLVVADVIMPGMDGFELASRIRASHSADELPILLMTGAGSWREAQQQALQVGAQEVLPKPFNARKLCDAVSRLIQRSRPTPRPDHTQAVLPPNSEEER